MTTTRHLTLTNWGAYDVETDGSEITAVHPFAKDPDPSLIGQSLKAVRRSRVGRVASEARPGVLVLAHQLLWHATEDELLDEVTAAYDEPFVYGRDLNVI